LQKRLERTQEGYELLEQKRQILVIELMAQVEAAGRVKDEVNEVMAAAYRALRRAAVRTGISGLARQSCGISMDHALAVRSRSVMGVPVPQIHCEPEPFGLQFGLSDGRSQSDEVLRRFLEALPLVADLAEVENAVFRLAREIRRTQRRVNALEKIYIPQYKEALKRMEEALAERQREEFVVLRKVKRKRQLARRTRALRGRLEGC
ncbi:MAG: V-type ATP synthase subunit D, partial [Planctomycetota bacterium]